MAIIGFIFCLVLGSALIVGSCFAYFLAGAFSGIRYFSDFLYCAVFFIAGAALLYWCYLSSPFEIILR